MTLAVPLSDWETIKLVVEGELEAVTEGFGLTDKLSKLIEECETVGVDQPDFVGVNVPHAVSETVLLAAKDNEAGKDGEGEGVGVNEEAKDAEEEDVGVPDVSCSEGVEEKRTSRRVNNPAAIAYAYFTTGRETGALGAPSSTIPGAPPRRAPSGGIVLGGVGDP